MDTVITPAQARTTLVGLRTGLGVGALLAPRLTGKLFGISVDENPAAVYLARLFGARELFMAAPFFMEDAEELQAFALQAGVAVDAADVVAASAACVRRNLRFRAAAMAALTAAAAVALGCIAQQED
jgi:Zn-dependent alcohol dehydrogenase